MAVYRLRELNREQARALAERSLLLLPVGALEQHGPHLPLATDSILVERVGELAAELLEADRPVVMAPTLPYGSSHHHISYGGTASATTEQFYGLVSDLCQSLCASGFRRIFLLNGHGGNHELLELVARDTALRHGATCAAASYWRVAEARLKQMGALEQGNVPGHAGAFETSLMLAVRPELVGEPPVRTGTAPHRANGDQTFRLEVATPFMAPDGFSDSPAAASADLGREYLRVCAEEVAVALRRCGDAAEE
jgi:creatinine amidohydrolase